MGDRVRAQFPVRNTYHNYLGMYITSHPRQLSMAIHSLVGAMSTSQRAMTPCGWGVQAGIVRVWVAGKTVSLCDRLVTHGPYLGALDTGHNKAL